jgi:hypothetical protein
VIARSRFPRTVLLMGDDLQVNRPDILAVDQNSNGLVCISLPPTERTDFEVKDALVISKGVMIK